MGSSVEGIKFIDTTRGITMASPPQTYNKDGIQWGSNSADVAYATYRSPVMLAVHAKDMIAI